MIKIGRETVAHDHFWHSPNTKQVALNAIPTTVSRPTNKENRLNENICDIITAASPTPATTLPCSEPIIMSRIIYKSGR